MGKESRGNVATIGRSARLAARAEAPAPVAPKVDEAVLERAAEEMRNLGRVDRVHAWDKRQGVKVDGPDGKLVPGPDVILCGFDRSHGPLIIHGSGSVLLCGAHKGGAPCTFNQPVSV